MIADQQSDGIRLTQIRSNFMLGHVQVGAKGPDAIDLYLKVMTHNLWHVRMPILITNMGFSSAVAVARGFIWARVAAQTWCQGDTYALSYFKKYLEEPAAVFFIAVVTVNLLRR